MEAQDLFGRKYRLFVNDWPVDGLRCSFDIEKTLKPEPNTAQVSIYNLSAESRAGLAQKGGVKVQLEAGYQTTGTSLIFLGELRDASSRHEPDGTWVTTLRAADGDGAHRKAKIAKSFRAPIDIERLVTAMVTDMKVGMGNAAKQLRSGKIDGLGKTFEQSVTANGALGKELQKLFASTQHEYSIQDGQLQVLRVGDVIQVPVSTVLSQSNGLDGEPEFDGEGGMVCRTRILPGLMPGFPIGLYTSRGKSVWRIERVQYTGDTHGDAWGADLYCREVKL